MSLSHPFAFICCVGGAEIRRAGAGDPGRCPGPSRCSSGLHPNPAGQPRGTASDLQSRSPETGLRVALPHSQRWAYPGKGMKPVILSLKRNDCVRVSGIVTNIHHILYCVFVSVLSICTCFLKFQLFQGQSKFCLFSAYRYVLCR